MIWKFLMADCREIAILVSRSMDGRIPWFQRFRVWLHLRICPPCSGHSRHLRALHRYAGPCLEASADTGALSAGRREKIRLALEKAWRIPQGRHAAR